MRFAIVNITAYISCAIAVTIAMNAEITVVMNGKYQRHAQSDSRIPILCFTRVYTVATRRDQNPIVLKFQRDSLLIFNNNKIIVSKIYL